MVPSQPTIRNGRCCPGRRAGQRGLALLGWLALGLPAPGGIPPVPQYQLGQMAREEVVTPVKLVVPKPADPRPETVVFRFCPDLDARAIAGLQAAFGEYRRRFQTNFVAATRGQPADARSLAHPSFARFVEWFQKWHPEFPLTDPLARTWARGESDSALLQAMEARLRSGLGRRIWSGDAAIVPPRDAIQVIEVASPQEPVTLARLEDQGQRLDPRALILLAQAREAFIRTFPITHQATGRFLSLFIPANCFPDARLTHQLHNLAAGRSSVEEYQPGQVIVQAGQRIDQRALAALAVLQAVRVTEPGAVPVTEAAPDAGPGFWTGSTTAPERWWAAARAMHQRRPWLVPLLLVAGAVIAGWMLRKRQLLHRKHRFIGGPSPYALIRDPVRNQTLLLPVPSPAKPEHDPNGAEGNPPAADTAIAAPPGGMELLRATERRAEDLIAQVRRGLGPREGREKLQRLAREFANQCVQLRAGQPPPDPQFNALAGQFTEDLQRWDEHLQSLEQHASEADPAPAPRRPENRRMIQAQLSFILNTPEATAARKKGRTASDG